MNNLPYFSNPVSKNPIKLKRVDAWACRYPIDIPVATSFGIMQNRPAVFIRIEDSDGYFGWGEIFANWPAAGAEHRVNLLMQDIMHLVKKIVIHQPSDLLYKLNQATHIPALQSGEWGPFRQVIAGMDIAIWDLYARRNNEPLRKFIDKNAANTIPVYASGIDIRDASRMIEKARLKGFNMFKVKVGYNFENDLIDITHHHASLMEKENLCADANQAWDVDFSVKFLKHTEHMNLQWLEEPMAADAADKDWNTITMQSTIAIAGGENIAGFSAFSEACQKPYLQILQPDIIKWGGVTGCKLVAAHAITSGKRYCPHYLGGGIGLSASAELLAATGGSGLLEIDVNENPLRDAFAIIPKNFKKGRWKLGNHIGIGIENLPTRIENCITLHQKWCS